MFHNFIKGWGEDGNPQMKVQRDQNEAFIEKLEKKQAGAILSFQKIHVQKDGMKFFDLKKKCIFKIMDAFQTYNSYF